MQIQESKEGKAVIARLAGRLDASTSSVLEERVVSIIDGGEQYLVVDFSNLDYISSAGLRVLLMAAKKLKGRGGDVFLSGLKAHIREVFDIAGFSSIFTIFSTSAEASGSIGH